MASLIERLSTHYPDWREHHATPIEAAVEVGLLDESALAAAEVPELDFNDGRDVERTLDSEDDRYDD